MYVVGPENECPAKIRTYSYEHVRRGLIRVAGLVSIMGELPTTWEEWIANFEDWQDRVGFNRDWLGDFDLSILFDWDRAGDVIEFGDFEGRAKTRMANGLPIDDLLRTTRTQRGSKVTREKCTRW